ncbi:MAG: putative colanic acid biosynthesis acetyltransferase [Planctomycetota bacterium]
MAGTADQTDRAVTDTGVAATSPSRTSPHGLRNRAARLSWGMVQSTLFRLSPRPMHAWRNLLLRAFGADLHPTARVYPMARVWGPWNLSMGAGATIADHVDCYCVDRITIGERTVISQYTYLCGATHDHTLRHRPLTPMPIVIGSDAWVAADVFVAPGVTVGDETVVGARSGVFTDLPARSICMGTPAKKVSDRAYRDGPEGGDA